MAVLEAIFEWFRDTALKLASICETKKPMFWLNGNVSGFQEELSLLSARRPGASSPGWKQVAGLTKTGTIQFK